MMNIQTIISISVTAIILLYLIIHYSIKAFKNGWVKKLYEELKQAVKDAENTQLKGEAKKAYVLERIEKTCEELGIPYRFIKKTLSSLIDKIIEYYNTISK